MLMEATMPLWIVPFFGFIAVAATREYDRRAVPDASAAALYVLVMTVGLAIGFALW
jgi:hypothetical protein